MKIKLRRPTPGPGLSGTDGTFQTKVEEHGDMHPLPPGTEKVDDKTPLSDWELEKTAKKDGGA